MASSRLALILLLALTAAARPASLELPGVARLELPANLLEEARLKIAATSPTGLHLRPGERVLAGIRVTGRVKLASARGALAEGVASFATASRSRHLTVVVKTRALALSLAGYVPRARVAGGHVDAPVPLPTWLSGPVEVFLVDYAESVEQVATAELVEDPSDSAPLGNRRPLVFVHGKDNHDLTETYHHEAKLAPFAKIRAASGFAALREHYKPYFFMYPSYRSTAENGCAFVEAVRAKLGPLADDRLVAIAYSMGGLVLRHAMATDGFAKKVGLAITASSPHHGAVAASLLFANARISERLGALATLVLRFGGKDEPDTPGLRSVAWDNMDGGITADEVARYGVLVNAELAAFNARWPHADRLVTFAGDVSTLLGGHQLFGVKDEIYRRTQGAWAPKYGNADPMVCFASGTFEGAPVRERVVFKDFDHTEILGHPKAIAAFVRLLQGQAIAVD